MSWFRRKKQPPVEAVYDVALAAPAVPPAPPLEEGPGAGVYNVVFRSADGANTRTKSLWGSTPADAKERAEAHEAEYCELTGAETYFYDHIDYLKEQQAR